MARDKKVRLSESEKELLRSTRISVFGDENVPYGLVIEQGCKALLAEDDSNEVNF
ncbi:hypothetical protein [Haloarcula sp. H-GB5]